MIPITPSPESIHELSKSGTQYTLLEKFRHRLWRREEYLRVDLKLAKTGKEGKGEGGGGGTCRAHP